MKPDDFLFLLTDPERCPEDVSPSNLRAYARYKTEIANGVSTSELAEAPADRYAGIFNSVASHIESCEGCENRLKALQAKDRPHPVSAWMSRTPTTPA